jgi:hypothetical protein
MLTPDRVLSLFDVRAGALYWKQPRKNVRVGERAGGVDSRGYYRVMVDQKNHYVHRILFLLYHGYMPAFVDHRDGDTTNNSKRNLRACTPAQNSQNRKRQVNNTSGVKGVYWNANKQKWMARVMVQGKREFVGYYEDISKAERAVEAARRKAHKEFSRNT